MFDVDLLMTPQAVLSGGRNTGGDFWGNVDYTLNVDTQKLGLWPAASSRSRPIPGWQQRIRGCRHPRAGKHRRLAARARRSHHRADERDAHPVPQPAIRCGRRQDQYVGLGRNRVLRRLSHPVSERRIQLSEQVPLSTFGGGVLVLPRDDIVLSALAIGPRGAPISNDVVQAFDGVMIVGSGKLTVKPFGLVGHQSLRFTWKNTERFSLDQDPSNIARVLLNERFPRLANPGPVLTQILANSFPGLPVPTQPANRKNSSWSMNYAFDQYFRQPDGDPKHGVGLFFAFGTSDGNPDPIQYAFLAGIGGKGVVPGPPPTTALASASPGPSSATVFFPFCASSSTSACNARMRSRCTTTWQLRRG